MFALPARSFRFLAPLLACLLGLSVLPAAEPVRVVATGGRIGTSFYTPAAGNTAFRHRTPHQLGGPVSEIQIGFMDWIYPYKAEAPNDTNDVTIDHAWLERASTGQILPVTFSGSRRLVLPMKSTTAFWLSDAIPSSAWKGSPPAADEVFWLNIHGTIPEGGKIPAGTPASFPGSRFVVYPSTNDTATVDAAGAVPAISGSSARVTGLPVIVLGRFAKPGRLSVIGIGDSILDGTGDAANPVPVIAGFGFFNRAAVDANGANAIAMFNLTRHGQTAANFSRQSRGSQFLPFANVIVEEYGTNDLGQNGTGSAEGIRANTEAIWSLARAAGVRKIIRTKLLPRSRSTDAWATAVNQTANPGWGPGGSRDTINTGFEAALAARKIDVLFDSLAILADPADSGRWLTNGTAKYVTNDGTHVSPAGNALLATRLRETLLSLKVE
jgi:lysophospholipase L1-like esterase